MVCARARFLARPRYLTLAKPHSCLTTRKACSPRARVRERARLIIRQRSLNGRWEVGRRLILFGDQAYWKEDDRKFLQAWGMRYLGPTPS